MFKPIELKEGDMVVPTGLRLKKLRYPERHLQYTCNLHYRGTDPKMVEWEENPTPRQVTGVGRCSVEVAFEEGDWGEVDLFYYHPLELSLVEE